MLARSCDWKALDAFLNVEPTLDKGYKIDTSKNATGRRIKLASLENQVSKLCGLVCGPFWGCRLSGKLAQRGLNQLSLWFNWEPDPPPDIIQELCVWVGGVAGENRWVILNACARRLGSRAGPRTGKEGSRFGIRREVKGVQGV